MNKIVEQLVDGKSYVQQAVDWLSQEYAPSSPDSPTYEKPPESVLKQVSSILRSFDVKVDRKYITCPAWPDDDDELSVVCDYVYDGAGVYLGDNKRYFRGEQESDYANDENGYTAILINMAACMDSINAVSSVGSVPYDPFDL